MKPRTNGASDALLIARLRADDENALEAIIDRYLDDVLGIAFHYVRTTDIANDIAQDIFVKIWERRHNLDVSIKLAPYLRTAARNSALKVLRHDAVDAKLERAVAEEYAAFRPHDNNSASTALDTEEFNEQVRSAFITLSPRVREVALLYHERGLEPGEIATLLGVAPKTIYNQLHTAMKALIRAFKGEA